MINKFKKNSGANMFVACLGKSSLKKNSSDYKTIRKLGKIIIEENFGIIHGGYSGGAMQAIDEGASEAINEQGKKNSLNIGVPYSPFDNDWQRVEKSMFSKPAKKLSERIDNIVCNSDIIVVLPKGGFGTLTELIYAFHMNQIEEDLNGKIRPIIFYGRNWKTLMKELMKGLDIKKQSAGKNWSYFVDTTEDFKKVLCSLQK
ncbi:MAG: LOG family protein [Candidatus Buchananbacteria bacterium]